MKKIILFSLLSSFFVGQTQCMFKTASITAARTALVAKRPAYCAAKTRFFANFKNIFDVVVNAKGLDECRKGVKIHREELANLIPGEKYSKSSAFHLAAAREDGADAMKALVEGANKYGFHFMIGSIDKYNRSPIFVALKLHDTIEDTTLSKLQTLINEGGADMTEAFLPAFTQMEKIVEGKKALTVNDFYKINNDLNLLLQEYDPS